MSHVQAVQEVMETFGVTEEQAEQVVALEEEGYVTEEDGTVFLDPDAETEIVQRS